MTICAETRHIRLCFLVLKWHSGVELDSELQHRNVTQSCEGRKGKKKISSFISASAIAGLLLLWTRPSHLIPMLVKLTLYFFVKKFKREKGQGKKSYIYES